MNSIKKLLDLLTPPKRKRTYLLLGMAVLAELVETNSLVKTTYKNLGYTEPQQLLFALGMLVFVLTVVSLAFKVLTTYAQLNFTLAR